MPGDRDSARSLEAVWKAAPDRLFLLSQASHAWTLIDAALSQRPASDPEYWFPAYFCESALPVLRARGRRMRFYPVTASLAPDWEACEQMAAISTPNVFTLLHPFGVESNALPARAFCDRHGALLHEDYAHVLLPFGVAGAKADLVSYSPRKFLPIRDGGLLICNGGIAGAIDRARASLPAVVHRAPLFDLANLKRRLRFGSRNPIRGAVRRDEEQPQHRTFAAIWMSYASRAVLADAVQRGEIDRVAGARRSAAAAINATLPGLFDLAPLPVHPDAAPRWIAFRAPDEAAAVHAIHALREADIAANTWPGLPPEVKADPSRFGAAMTLRRTLVRVPAQAGVVRRLAAIHHPPREARPAGLAGASPR